MLKALISTTLLFLATSSFAGPAEDYCEGEWPDDYQMQAYCIDQQNAAQDRLDSFKSEHDLTGDNLASKASDGDIPARIMKRCMAEWPNDMQMADYCIKQQVKSAKQLGKM